MKKKICILCIVACAALAIGIGIFAVTRNKLDHWELNVNGNKIDQNEYIRLLDECIYETTQYFVKTYQANVNQDFWTADFNGEVPYRVLADRALSYLIEERIYYEIAKEKGYIESASYQDLLNRLEEENKQRAEKIKNNEPVYGLSEFTLKLFIEYEMDSIQKQYCNDLTNKEMQVSDQEREAYYEENKDAMFQKNDDLELEYIKINYLQEELETEKVNGLKEEMNALSKEAGSAGGFASLMEQHTDLMSYYTKELILSGEMSSKAKVIGDILELAVDLKKGDMTQVIDQNGALYLIRCEDRIEYDFVPLEEVKDIINKNIREEHFDNMVKQRVEKAVITGQNDGFYQFVRKHVEE